MYFFCPDYYNIFLYYYCKIIIVWFNLFDKSRPQSTKGGLLLTLSTVAYLANEDAVFPYLILRAPAYSITSHLHTVASVFSTIYNFYKHLPGSQFTVNVRHHGNVFRKMIVFWCRGSLMCVPTYQSEWPILTISITLIYIYRSACL